MLVDTNKRDMSCTLKLGNSSWTFDAPFGFAPIGISASLSLSLLPFSRGDVLILTVSSTPARRQDLPPARRAQLCARRRRAQPAILPLDSGLAADRRRRPGARRGREERGAGRGREGEGAGEVLPAVLAACASSLASLLSLPNLGSARSASSHRLPTLTLLLDPQNKDLTRSLLEDAVKNGYEACILTTDTWQLGWRHGDIVRVCASPLVLAGLQARALRQRARATLTHGPLLPLPLQAAANYAFYVRLLPSPSSHVVHTCSRRSPPLQRGVGHDLGRANPVFRRMCAEKGIDDLDSPEAGQYWIDNVWCAPFLCSRAAGADRRRQGEADADAVSLARSQARPRVELDRPARARQVVEGAQWRQAVRHQGHPERCVPLSRPLSDLLKLTLLLSSFTTRSRGRPPRCRHARRRRHRCVESRRAPGRRRDRVARRARGDCALGRRREADNHVRLVRRASLSPSTSLCSLCEGSRYRADSLDDAAVCARRPTCSSASPSRSIPSRAP